VYERQLPADLPRSGQSRLPMVERIEQLPL
jgi:hypothetical protein